jgi:sodium/bile acid cotransporter 7
MRSFLEKRWFLLLLITGLAIAWFQPAWLAWTELIDPRFIVAPALFLTAWSLESRSLYRTLLRPWPALWASFVSYSFLPGVAYLAGRLLDSEDFRVGLLISASVPCTLVAALVWTRLAGGNEATALLVIMITTCTSWLATTAWLSFGVGTAVALDSLGLMRSLFVVLVVPVGLGQGLRAVPLLAATADRYRTALGVVARLLVLIIILKAATDVLARLGPSVAEGLAVGAILSTLAACLGTHLLALTTGFWSGRALGFERADCIAIAFSCSQKTLPVALFLFDAYFQDAYPLAVVPMVFYHVGQLIVDTFIADEMKRHALQQQPLITSPPPPSPPFCRSR